MTIVADENVDRAIVTRLREEGHAVYDVAEMEPSISDDAVLARAREYDAILLTADKDFGDLIYRQGMVHGGVILIRFAGASPIVKAEIVVDVIREHAEEMVGSFSVVTATSIRIRRQERLS